MMLTSRRARGYSLQGVGSIIGHPVPATSDYRQPLTHTEGGLEKASSPSSSRCSNKRYDLRTWFSSSRPHPSSLAA